MKGSIVGAALAAGILVPALARAQQPPALPRWDAGASFGLVFGDGWRLDSGSDGPRAAYHFELGRFWTTHVKTDGAVILTRTSQGYDYSNAVPGRTAYTFTHDDRKLTAFSGALTYQFFENAMMHPFVTAGVQVGVRDDHLYRDSEVYPVGNSTFVAPALDMHTSTVLARPFAGVGAKSYFNERTFIKSELSFGLDGGGVSHSILRLGFGVDF